MKYFTTFIGLILGFVFGCAIFLSLASETYILGRQVQKAQEECEKELPRNQFCENIIISIAIKQETNK